jgi:Na+/H+-dicarboxylate symporter
MKPRLTWIVAIATIAGLACGVVLHGLLGPAGTARAVALFSLITAAFLRLIKMIIAPLVFCTLSVGVARMDGAGSIVRVGARTIGWFLFATLVSLGIGLGSAHLFKPGLGMTPPAITGDPPAAVPLAPMQVMEHIIPASVVQAMAANEILQIVVFAILFGAAAASLGSKAAALVDVIDQAAGVILRMTGYVMAVAPLAVFSALASTVMTQGVGVLGVYAKFIAAFYVAIALLWCVLAAFLYIGIGARSRQLLLQIRAPLLLAFSTASSEAAYPRTLQSLQDFGISARLASFVLPLGYSFNLDGTALYCSFGVLFIAQIFRIDMSVQQEIMMVLVLMVMSKGVAGVPRAALMVVSASLSYFGLPEQGLVFIVAVDHLLDMGRTATNVIGNAVAAALVAKWEGDLKESDA